MIDDVPGREGDAGIVRSAGELDTSELDRLRAAARAAKDQPGVRRLVFDLTDVTFVDSSILGVFLEFRRETDADGVTVVLRNPHPRVLRLLDVTALLAVFVVEDDRTPDS